MMRWFTRMKQSPPWDSSRGHHSQWPGSRAMWMVCPGVGRVVCTSERQPASVSRPQHPSACCRRPSTRFGKAIVPSRCTHVLSEGMHRLRKTEPLVPEHVRRRRRRRGRHTHAPPQPDDSQPRAQPPAARPRHSGSGAVPTAPQGRLAGPYVPSCVFLQLRVTSRRHRAYPHTARPHDAVRRGRPLHVETHLQATPPIMSRG